jgi:hypothetical protein
MYCPSSIYRRWGTPVMRIEGQRAAVALLRRYSQPWLVEAAQRELARREYRALVGMVRS